MLEFLFEVIGRFVGISATTLLRYLRSGFKVSYLEEWKKEFSKDTSSYRASDILGLVVIVILLVLIFFFGVK